MAQTTYLLLGIYDKIRGKKIVSERQILDARVQPPLKCIGFSAGKKLIKFDVVAIFAMYCQ